MQTHNGATVTNPLQVVNVFNVYFSSIAEKNKANIKFSNKSFKILFIILIKIWYSENLQMHMN